ncbi:hypothetical protein jhhlp_007762 [Lomentospora prolificans]|uniref:Hemerythrin-like domain-containing protein n=1 Tax=Lomentospora prolificans TaxID=41688 RepID=A0A2N3N0H3_9PEZI|nr:hypothetical protein jhhlp_007762 [Lomentospora prolificans]
MTTILRRAYPAIITRPVVGHRHFVASAIQMARISDIIKQDHREIQQAYENILDSKDPSDKVRWRNQFTWELARHSIGEELMLYPAFEKHVQQGKSMAARDREEHLMIKKDLAVLQDMSPDHPEFGAVLGSLWGNLRQHIQEEEHEDLVALEKALSPEESDAMVRSFQRTKMLTPTRSHPNAPDKPPFETVAGLMAAPLDKIRDLFREFPEEKTSH